MYPEPFRVKREPGSVVLASFKVTKNASNAASDQSQATKSIIPPYFYHRLVCPKPSPFPPPLVRGRQHHPRVARQHTPADHPRGTHALTVSPTPSGLDPCNQDRQATPNARLTGNVIGCLFLRRVPTASDGIERGGAEQRHPNRFPTAAAAVGTASGVPRVLVVHEEGRWVQREGRLVTFPSVTYPPSFLQRLTCMAEKQVPHPPT